jgi:hypothetical protein
MQGPSHPVARTTSCWEADPVESVAPFQRIERVFKQRRSVGLGLNGVSRVKAVAESAYIIRLCPLLALVRRSLWGDMDSLLAVVGHDMQRFSSL